ncbi:hypothetical protein ACH5RR_005652 [Cinchona calisaya]|uniref:Uncharacterized protein n=1 Tax=Cinchona calisaya TaxID=153742 RepID=A0ABD3AM06_9GENT
MAASSLVSAITRWLEGKVALITGGATGIGECTAKLFSRHGDKVVIADIQDEVGHSLINKTLGSSNGTYIHCDVTNENHVKSAVDKTVEAFGKLDIMFNNAGIAGESTARIIDYKKSDFERVLGINVTGVFLGTKHAASVMILARSGSIISMVSIASGIGGSAAHAYTTSKHAVVGLTRNLAVELGQYGIRVNCLSPFAGTTFTTDEFVKAALYLASDDAQFVSGHKLFVDGGLTICNSAFNLFDNPES